MMALSDEEQERLKFLTSYLRNRQTHLMNEATIWSRAIYPLLMLAERGNIQAWAGVPLKAQPVFTVELSGQYFEQLEAETILQILKFIAAKYINESIST